MIEDWRKYTSTNGYKPHFYRLYQNGVWKATVVWNRSARAYAVEVAKTLPNRVTTGVLLEYVDTPGQGKAAVRRWLKSQ